MTTIELNYLDIGEGRPTVLLMGLGANAAAWSPHFSSWSASRRCIAIDNRGAGLTRQGVEPATTSNMAADTAALLDRLELEQCDVVGISMGSCIAQELALARPDLVRKLVLVAPWATVDAYTASVLSSLASLRAEAPERLFNQVLRDLVWTPAWINAHAVDMASTLSAPPAMTVEAFSDQASACATHESSTRLAWIAAPTLVTYGSADRFITPDQSLAVAKGIPHTETVEFPGLGHVHHWEELVHFNELVNRWLA